MINATNDNKPQKSSSDPNPISSVVKNDFKPSDGDAKPMEKASDPVATPTESTQKNLNEMAQKIISDESPAPTMPSSATPPTALTPSVAKMATPPMKTTPTPPKPPGFDERNVKSKQSEKPAHRKSKFNVKMIAGVFVLLLIVVGAGAGFFLSQQTQDIRQQADTEVPYTGNECLIDDNCASYGSESYCDDGYCLNKDPGNKCGDEYCNLYQVCIDNSYCGVPGPREGGACNQLNNPCIPPLVCHCEGGDPCETAICELPGTTKDRCIEDGRAWCDNFSSGGAAKTCCFPGYECRDDEIGCFPVTTPPPTTPPPTTPPPILECNNPCTADTQCSNINSSWTCDDTTNRCRLISNPTSVTCEPPVVVGEPMCKDVAILDANNNELDPAVDPFSIGMVLKFRCAADDPDSQITNYEFRVTEPDGTIINGAAINPAGSSATSLEYQIDQYLSHTVQCRVCTSAECQDWVAITP